MYTELHADLKFLDFVLIDSPETGKFWSGSAIVLWEFCLKRDASQEILLRRSVSVFICFFFEPHQNQRQPQRDHFAFEVWPPC